MDSYFIFSLNLECFDVVHIYYFDQNNYFDIVYLSNSPHVPASPHHMVSSPHVGHDQQFMTHHGHLNHHEDQLDHHLNRHPLLLAHHPQAHPMVLLAHQQQQQHQLHH